MPCPREAPALAAALPGALVTWSNVTGRCVPWGPGGPLGTLAGGLLVRNAVLGNPVVNGPGGPRRAKAAKDVQSRRSEEVEQGLRDADALAKRNVPFVGALLVLLLSVPRSGAGGALGLAAAGLGAAAALAQGGGAEEA